MKYQIHELNKDNIEYTVQFDQLRPLDIKKQKLQMFINNGNNLCYFALLDQQVVGLAWGYILPRFDNESMLYIHSVDVLESHRSQGVGTMLIESFLTYAKNHKFRNTFLITDEKNVSGNKLYQKFNYELETHKNLYVFKG